VECDWIRILFPYALHIGFSCNFPVPNSLTSVGSCFEHNTVKTSNLGATNNHSWLSSWVHNVWFSYTIRCEHEAGIDRIDSNIWASHSSSMCVSCTGWLCLHTLCSLVTDLHLFISATPSIVKYRLAVSISRYSCFGWINMNLGSVPLILIG